MREVTRAIIVNEKNEVLIGLRARGAGENLWALVGGKFDPDETPEMCVLREVKEELGADFDPKIWKEEIDISSDSGTEWKVYYFTGSLKGAIHRKEDEILETRWVSAKDIEELAFAFGHKRVLKDFFS